MFRNVSITQFGVGHSHNEIDRRFAVVAQALSNAPVLQTPDCFVKEILSIRPMTGMEIRAETIQMAPQFKPWLDNLTPYLRFHHQAGQHSGHMVKFVRREDLSLPAEIDLLELSSTSVDCEKHAKDVVMLTKDYMCSKELNQHPQVVASFVFSNSCC